MQRQSRYSLLSHPLISSGVPLGIAALLAITIPSAPANALRFRSIEEPTDYGVCADRLLRAGVSPNDLANVCAASLRPEELSRCALKIKLRTPVAPLDAVSACSQVRRPNDLSTCVLEINSRTKNPVATDVLDYCRRSLLPISFSECVIALNRTIDISTAGALATCTAADYDLPTSPYRTFVPLALPPIPTTPSTSPSTSPLPPISPPNQQAPAQ